MSKKKDYTKKKEKELRKEISQLREQIRVSYESLGDTSAGNKRMQARRDIARIQTELTHRAQSLDIKT